MAVCHIDATGGHKQRDARVCAMFQGPLGQLHSPIFVEHIGPMHGNEAEWLALLLALRKGVEHGEQQMHIFSDSKVMVEQVNHKYAVRAPRRKRYFAEAMDLIKRFNLVVVQFVPREKNAEADYYAKHGAPLQ